MNLSGEDRKLLDELCDQNGVSTAKVLKLLEAVYEPTVSGPSSAN